MTTRSSIRFAAALALATLGLALPQAQARRPGNPPAPPDPTQAQMRRAGGPMYDTARETTVTGTVARTYTVPTGPDQEFAVLAIAVDGKPLNLLLGPPSYVESLKITFKAGVAVEAIGVTGGHVNGEDAMLTRSVKIGERTIALRDEKGAPAWEKAGGRRP